MGWYGNWNIKYNGNNSEKFVNLAKLIIPNYVKRFEETEKGMLDCKRSLSWYSADVDIAKIMEYLDENNTIDVEIDGETHPIREVINEGGEFVREGTPSEEDFDYYITDKTTGVTTYHFNTEYEEPEIDYYEYEKQTFRKENGSVVIDNEHPDEDRYTSSNLGIQEMFTYEIAYPESAHEEGKEGDTDTVSSYIKYIAQQFAGNEEFMPIVQDFLYSIFDPQKLKDLTNEEYNYFSNRITPDEKILAKIASIREQFKTVESTKAFLDSIREQNPELDKKESATERVVPNFIANMSKRDINNLGGLEQLLKLVEVKGEDYAKELLSILGYTINDSKAQEQPTLEDLEFEKTLLEGKEQQAKQLYQEYEQQLPNREEDISIE
ncbi:MAG: hypothetical protein HFJ55_02985 [Clostridia bacterium]|nr:hypothetical protein [Clostridia bacterium]